METLNFAFMAVLEAERIILQPFIDQALLKDGELLTSATRFAIHSLDKYNLGLQVFADMQDVERLSTLKHVDWWDSAVEGIKSDNYKPTLAALSQELVEEYEFDEVVSLHDVTLVIGKSRMADLLDKFIFHKQP